MLSRVFRSLVLKAAAPVVLALGCVAEAHVVPNMTIEAGFDSDGGFTLRINVDPRTFLAADPTTLPPVPGSWYREQTPGQTAATHEKAREYLSRALGLVFDGRKIPLPACEIQAIDGADNTPLKPDTQEVHLLATAHSSAPPGSGSFQIDFSKDANTTLILLQGRKGAPDVRTQVVFPGEVSRPFAFQVEKKPEVTAPPRPVVSKAGRVWVGILTASAIIILVIGWRLLARYRHYHRMHRRPGAEDVNN